MPYRSRHGPRNFSGILSTYYTRETWKEYSEMPPAVDEDDEAWLETLRSRIERDGSGKLRQTDREKWDEILTRKEEREDARCAPLAREIESYFENLQLPPLPPPVARSSHWYPSPFPQGHEPEEVRGFYDACREGSIDEVKEWVTQKKDLLRPIGIRDGMDLSAEKNHVEVVQYLLEEAGSSGTPLCRCLDDDAITSLLLEAGADPNIAPISDLRRKSWGARAVVPMDRTSGVVLDMAMAKSSFAIIKKLLDSGADIKYSRPFIKIARNRSEYAEKKSVEDDWRELMELLLSYGGNINAGSWSNGTALKIAVGRGRWDMVGFMLDRGADPRGRGTTYSEDAFGVAARVAGISWEETPEMKAYLDSLAGKGEGGEVPAPSGAENNPLVKFIVEREKAVPQAH